MPNGSCRKHNRYRRPSKSRFPWRENRVGHKPGCGGGGSGLRGGFGSIFASAAFNGLNRREEGHPGYWHKLP